MNGGQVGLHGKCMKIVNGMDYDSQKLKKSQYFRAWIVPIYLTPARLSDHLFKPQGNRTTIPPKIIIAYIWDIISINYHLRLNSCSGSKAILDYKCFG